MTKCEYTRVQNDTMMTNCEYTSVHEDTMMTKYTPVQKDTMMTKCEYTPVQKDTMMTKCEYTPVQKDTMITKCEYAPVQKDTMMTNCEYAPVHNGTTAGDDGRSWIPFLRQLMVCSTMCSLYFQVGLCMGAITVLIPRMREEKGENYISQAMVSWISSAMSYSSMPWIPLLAILASYIGRRYTFSLSVIASLVGFSLLYVAETPQLVLGAKITQGLTNATLMMTFFILPEYSSPENRGVFLALKSATMFWGIWVANAIGTVAHWRYIAVLGLACALYNMVTLFFWPESPYWLACKGRMHQCKEAHRWLKGHGVSSEKELQQLIKSQQQHMEVKRGRTQSQRWRQICLDMKSKYVYKSVLMSIILHLQNVFSGKIVYTIYAIDIIKSISKSRSDAYRGMLILDGVTVLGMYIGCALCYKLKRRTLLFISGGISIVFLLMMSLYLYLVKFGCLLETKYVTLLLLSGFSISVSCGPIILNTTLAAELLSLRLRTTSAAFLGLLSFFMHGSSLKAAPFIFSKLGFPGAFLMFGLTSGTLLLVLFIILPETKNKTYKEIEELIVGYWYY